MYGRLPWTRLCATVFCAIMTNALVVRKARHASHIPSTPSISQFTSIIRVNVHRRLQHSYELRIPHRCPTPSNTAPQCLDHYMMSSTTHSRNPR